MKNPTLKAIQRSLMLPVRRWTTRRQLERLLHHPERLSDIGLDRRSALAETRKPFWED